MRFFSFILLMLIVAPVGAQSVQKDLRTAALNGERDRVEELVAGWRLEAKPVVQELVREAALDGASAESAKAAATLVAATFEGQYGEKSLSLMVSQLDRWSASELRQKANADSLLASGIAIRTTDRPAAAELFEQARAAYEGIADLHGIAEVTGQLGYVAWFLDQPSYVAKNLEALEARKAVDDQRLLSNTYNDLGLGNRLLTRDYDAALEYYSKGEAIRKAIGDTARLAPLVANIARTYEAMGRYVEARDRYLEGAELYLVVGDSANWIIQRRNTAGLMTNFAGRHTDALGILLELREDLKVIEDAEAEALVLGSIGVVRRRLGDYRGAVAEYQEVIRIAEEQDLSDILAQTLNNLGVVFIFMDQPDRSIRFLERAHAARVDRGEAPSADVLLSLGSAHYQMREYEEAQRWLDLADELTADLAQQSIAVMLRADIQTRTGREEEAKAIYETLLTLADELELPSLRSGAYFGLAYADERLGNAEAALDYYELAAAELEQKRGLLTAEEDKAGFLAQTRYLYEEIIHFLTKEAVAEPNSVFAARAFEFAERAKARAFLDQMAEALADVRSGVDPEFQADLDVLADNMAYLRGELAATERSERERIAELKRTVRQMELGYERVEREMLERNPRFAAIRYPRPATLAEIQADVLGEGDLLLQYALGDSSSTLWAVTADAVNLYQLPPRPEIEGQIELLRFVLEDPSREVTEPASNVYKLLVSPAEALVAGADEIIVVPDGALNYVPFEALVSGDGSYLLSRGPVSYAQSASVLRQLRSEPPVTPSMELLAVGDPAFGGSMESSFLRGEALARLPFSGVEASAIAGLFPEDSSRLLLAEEATEQAVIEALERDTYRFVHFATHGLVNDDRPDYSGLALAGSGTDALLQASEIFNLDVEAELVVLSACETGLGQLVKGEGMVGLTRAFMYAGAPSVAVSLWSVSDQSTSTLMQGLYGSLQNPLTSKSQAVRAAKLALLENDATAHPFHWAPFILVGLHD